MISAPSLLHGELNSAGTSGRHPFHLRERRYDTTSLTSANVRGIAGIGCCGVMMNACKLSGDRFGWPAMALKLGTLVSLLAINIMTSCAHAFRNFLPTGNSRARLA